MAGSNGGAIAAAVVSIFFSVASLFLRFSARARSPNKYGLDDYAIIPATVFVLGMALSLIMSANHGGLGQHEQLTPSGEPVYNNEYIYERKTDYMMQLFDKLANGTAKVAILLLYRRMFEHKRFQVLLKIGLVVIAAWAFSYFIAAAAQCTPSSAYWGPWSQIKSHCVNRYSLYLSFAITDLITDVLVVMLPVPILLRIEMTLKQKIGALATGLAGFLVIAIGSTRLFEFFRVVTLNRESADVSYYSAAPAYWACVESAALIFAATLPTLRTLFANVDPEQMAENIRRRLSIRSNNGYMSQDSIPNPLRMHPTHSPRASYHFASSRDSFTSNYPSPPEVRETFRYPFPSPSATRESLRYPFTASAASRSAVCSAILNYNHGSRIFSIAEITQSDLALNKTDSIEIPPGAAFP